MEKQRDITPILTTMKLPTLTIGIAAYNEENNIGLLLDALFSQDIHTATLDEILVVSDGSTDRTDEIVGSYDQSKVRLIRQKERSGQNAAQNVIHTLATGDILVVLDADMLPSDVSFIDGMIRPIILCEADLVGVQLLPSKPVSFFERMLAEIHRFKVRLYESFRNGRNIYMCFGPARSFSRALYSTLQYPDNCPTDAYSYMFAKTRRFTFVPLHNPPALFRVPSTFRDHFKQSSRFMAGKKTLEIYFGAIVVRDEFTIPRYFLFKACVVEFITHPFFFTSFVLVNFYVRLKKGQARFTSRWEIAKSTKAV